MTFLPCCAILFGAVDGPGISGNSLLTQKQLQISDHNLACMRCSQTMPFCTGSATLFRLPLFNPLLLHLDQIQCFDVG